MNELLRASDDSYGPLSSDTLYMGVRLSIFGVGKRFGNTRWHGVVGSSVVHVLVPKVPTKEPTRNSSPNDGSNALIVLLLGQHLNDTTATLVFFLLSHSLSARDCCISVMFVFRC